MSYDIGIGDFWANYTGNLAEMFHAHVIDYGADGEYKTGIQCLFGKSGKDAIPILRRAFESLFSEYCTTNNVSVFRKKYDAGNGWGSTDGALIFLARIMAACAENPRKKISGSE